MSQEGVIRNKIAYVYKQNVDRFQNKEFTKEWFSFYDSTMDCDWSPEIFTSEVSGVADSYMERGRSGRWGKEPEKAIELLNKLDPFQNISFFEWFKRHGSQFPMSMAAIFMHDYLRKLCLEFAEFLIFQNKTER